jgi:integrase
MRIAFTAKLIASLDFERRPLGVDADGTLIYAERGAVAADYREWVLRDAALPGFGIRLTKGAKSYFVQRKRGGSTSDRYRLTDQHSLTAARAQAQKWLGIMANGGDPRPALADMDADRKDARARKAYTMERVLEAYATGGVGLRPATVYDRSIALRWLRSEPLATVPLDALTRANVEATFGPMFRAAEVARAEREAHPERKRGRGAGPRGDVASAWKLLRHCSAAWAAEERPKGPANPFAAFRKRHMKTLPKVERRRTSLQTHGVQASTKWLKALLKARKDKDHTTAVAADYFLCLLLWGGRRAEVQKVRWSDVDFDVGTVRYREAHTKTRRALVVPMTPWAAEVLRERKAKNKAAALSVDFDDWVFASAVDGKHLVEVRDIQEMLRKASGIWVGPHDLRRTVASDLFGDTRNLDTVGLALGHAGSEGNVSAGYVVDMERLRALRPLYEAREQRLRQAAGLETIIDPFAHFTSEQRAVYRAAMEMLKASGIVSQLAPVGPQIAEGLPPASVRTVRDKSSAAPALPTTNRTVRQGRGRPHRPR